MASFYGTLSTDIFIGNVVTSNDYYFEQWEFTVADSILGGIYTDRIHFTGSHSLDPVINPLDGLFSVEYLYFDDLGDSIAIPDSLAVSSSDFSDWRLAVHGGGGDDFIDASDVTSDVALLILAEDDDDVVIGGGEGSYYDGGDGEDEIYLSPGVEEALGGDGDDQFFASALAISGDTIDGGADYDTLTMTTAGNFSLTLSNMEAVWLDGSGDNDVTIHSPSHDGGEAITTDVYGDDFDDYITVEPTDGVTPSGTPENFLMLGLEGNDILTGGDGDDYLNGGAGVDGLDGGEGDDTLIGDGEGDLMSGGAGHDTYFGVASGDLVIEGPNGGIDTIQTLQSTYTLPTFVEELDYDGTAALTAIGNAENNGMGGGVNGDTISGRGGVDWLVGYEGEDNLFGEEGDDLLMGGSEDDELDGGTGADTMFGDEGSDVYVVDNTGDAITELANEGDGDFVFSSITYTLGPHLEHLWLDGTANLNATGNGLGNTLVGNSGGNIVNGRGGADTLYGFAGRDTLDGGGNADTLYGGADADDLWGRSGADTFRFTTLAENGSDVLRDTIRDFVAGTDKIDLTGLGFSSLVSGVFTGTAGELRTSTGANTFLFGDADGDRVTDFYVILSGVVPLTLGDFIL